MILNALKSSVFSLLGRLRLSRVHRQYELCIFKPDGIGDLVLAQGAIKLLAEKLGEERILCVVSDRSLATARHLFPRIDCIEVPLDLPKTVWHKILALIITNRALTSTSCDTLISLRHQRTKWQELTARWLRCKVSIASIDHLLSEKHTLFQESMVSNWDTIVRHIPALFSSTEIEPCRELLLHAAILSSFLKKPVTWMEIMPCIPAQEAEDNCLLISPHGSVSIRDIESDFLLRFLKSIPQSTFAEIRLLATPSQEPRIQELAEILRVGGVTTPVTVRTTPTVSDYFGQVAKALAVLTTETATAHIATAMNKPTVTLLGGGHYGMFAPWRRSTKQIWITHSLHCFGCGWKCIHPKPLCITEIDPAYCTQQLIAVTELGKLKHEQ
jgi:ADP-heptose:LPS heptosyltransferase